MDSARTSLKIALEEMRWPEAVAEELVASAHVITYEKGAMVFHAGEPADLLYVLLSGEVKLYYGSAEGERLLVSIAQRGQMLGLIDLVPNHLEEGEPTQLFTAEALSRCSVAIIAKARLGAAVSRLPAHEIGQLMRRLNERWTHFCERFLAFLTMDVRSRLSYAIAEIGDAFGVPDARGKLIRLKLTHDNFGELVGASRPMVSKHLKDLAEAGVFFKENGHYVLAKHNPGALGVGNGNGASGNGVVAEQRTGKEMPPVRLLRTTQTRPGRVAGVKLGAR